MRPNPNRALILGLMVGLMAGLTACTHHPTITYPTLPEVGAREAGLDCQALEASILKADTIRWVMREDGARLLTDAELAERFIGEVALVVWTWMPGPELHEGHFALNRADLRLRDLLELKRQRGCTPTPTLHPGMTDMQLLDALSRLDYRSPAMSKRQRLDERSRLLDGLRIPQSVSGSPAPD